MIWNTTYCFFEKTVVFSHQSYWDWLPTEIQCYCLALAASQHAIDQKRKKHWNKTVMHELFAFVEIREAWKYDDIEDYIRFRRKLCNHACCKNAHLLQWMPTTYKNPSTKKKSVIYIGHPKLSELIARSYHIY